MITLDFVSAAAIGIINFHGASLINNKTEFNTKPKPILLARWRGLNVGDEQVLDGGEAPLNGR